MRLNERRVHTWASEKKLQGPDDVEPRQRGGNVLGLWRNCASGLWSNNNN